MTISIDTIIKKYLKDNGYNGLVYPDLCLCCCHINNLFSCKEDYDIIGNCIPTIIKNCETCTEKTLEGCSQGKEFCLENIK